jgi:hypothetical protein
VNNTRADIDRSIDATNAALARLFPDPARLNQLRDRVRIEVEDFIAREWLALTPEEKRRAAVRRAAAEAFHASVRVHDFGSAP